MFGLRRVVVTARDGAFVGSLINAARAGITRYPHDDRRFTYEGMHHGIIDAADFLKPRLRRRFIDGAGPPEAVPNGRPAELYLAGYLSGTLITAMMRERVRHGLATDGAEADALLRACAAYATVVASPPCHAQLALVGASALDAVHASALAVAQQEATVDAALAARLRAWLETTVVNPSGPRTSTPAS